jgi:hypothetical protein
MACAAKLGYHLHIRRYVQLSEFGYCLHNVLKDELPAILSDLKH